MLKRIWATLGTLGFSLFFMASDVFAAATEFDTVTSEVAEYKTPALGLVGVVAGILIVAGLVKTIGKKAS